VLTSRPATLGNDFFADLLDMSTKWSKSPTSEGLSEGRDRASAALTWTATPVDLVFGPSLFDVAGRKSASLPTYS